MSVQHEYTVDNRYERVDMDMDMDRDIGTEMNVDTTMDTEDLHMRMYMGMNTGGNVWYRLSDCSDIGLFRFRNKLW